MTFEDSITNMFRAELANRLDRLTFRQPSYWFACLEGDIACLEKTRIDGTVIKTKYVPRDRAFKELNRLNRFRWLTKWL